MKYTITDFHRLHMRWCKKEWLTPILSMSWFKKRYEKFEDLEITFAELIEKPNAFHWKPKRWVKEWYSIYGSLLSKCKYYWMKYTAVYPFLKKNNIKFEEFIETHRDNEYFLL